MEVIVDHIDFPPGTGERQLSTPARTFNRRVLGAWVALRGYSAQYSGEDEDLQRLTVFLGVSQAKSDAGWEVRVFAEFNLRDEGGDDDCEGRVDYTLFVDLESSFAWLTTLFGLLKSA